MLRSEAIKKLLIAKTHADLAELYSKNMEVQFNVAQDGGDRMEEDFKGRTFHSYTDGINKWSHFRIPRNAKTVPEDNDCQVHGDLYQHAEGVGLTGWDWCNRVSRWVAYDFDAMTGHSDKHEKKMTDQELQQLREVVSAIPWVTIRLSTSGKGIHLYVFLEPVATQNHTEHAALARAILGLMASITGYDFQSKVDTCGSNMWIWHRKMTGTKGLTVVKQGVLLTAIPQNWRDHVRVVSGESRRTLPAFIAENKEANPNLEEMFEELTGTKTLIPLDAEHKRLLNFLYESKACAWWEQDHNMAVTHTVHLQEAFNKLNLKGVFKTNAKGENYGQDHNCFMYPGRRGSWVVRRYTPGVAEESTWDQDQRGYTRCYLNRDLDLATACRSFNANEHEGGGYVFREAEVAAKAATLLGIDLGVPSWAGTRSTLIKKGKDGKFIVQMDATEHDDPREMTQWNRKGKKWSRVLNGKADFIPETEGRNYDEVCRHIISSANSNLGWLLRAEKDWIEEPLTHVSLGLKGIVGKQALVDTIVGEAALKPWKIVCRPFEPEYPKAQGREWNRNAPQLRFRPTNSDSLSYPTWLKMLTHCGKSLNDPLKKNAWAKSAGILTGADYLKIWLASLFQQPMAPLPYLFFHGPQDSGKSIFHESIGECLLTSGVVRADTALTNQQAFNGELETALVGVIEEISMKNNRIAYNRIKDWVTSAELSIHRKGKTPYSVINYLKLIHTANERDAVPIMEGDTRIVMMYVSEITPTDKIPKKFFMQQLQKEAPDFIAELLRIEIPESNDRLNVPVITTEEKVRAQQASQTYLETFLNENYFFIPGEAILFRQLVDDFHEWLPANERDNWNMKTIGQSLPQNFVKGRSPSTNQVMIGNITKNKDAVPKKPLVVRNEKLVPNND